MSTIVEPAAILTRPTKEQATGRQELAKGALGLREVLFCIVTGAARWRR